MEQITTECDSAQTNANRRDALRQTRTPYLLLQLSSVRGDDILQDSEDEEEEHARQQVGGCDSHTISNELRSMV
jgi:hypothetical protein